MTKKDLINEMQIVLANSYAIFLKTQNFHWNITGPNFKSLHDLFEEQYKDLFYAIDDIAESIRILGEKVAANFQQFDKLKIIEDGRETLKDVEMVKKLAADHKTIISLLYKTLDAAQTASNEAICALLSTRIEAHEKHAWKLESSL